jgi:hypothetical protein
VAASAAVVVAPATVVLGAAVVVAPGAVVLGAAVVGAVVVGAVVVGAVVVVSAGCATWTTRKPEKEGPAVKHSALSAISPVPGPKVNSPLRPVAVLAGHGSV